MRPYLRFPFVVFKTDKIRDRALFLHPDLIEIMTEMSEWAERSSLVFVVTETVTTPEEDQGLDRDSATHAEGRAFDVSIKAWLPGDISEFIRVFNSRFQHLGAIGTKSGKPALLVRHDSGHGDHIHVQLSRLYANRDPLAKMRLA